MRQDAYYIVINFDELWLKGKNRHQFIERLMQNIKSALGKEEYKELKLERDRLVIYPNDLTDIKSLKFKLGRIFGISKICTAAISNSTMDDIVSITSKFIDKRRCVRIVAHRSVKTLPFTSKDLISSFLENKDVHKINMDINSKDIVRISIKKDKTYILSDVCNGLRGLPIGSSGSAVSLLSGGIDSPVSSYMAMRRGLKLIYLHVHGFESNDDPQIDKIVRTIKIPSFNGVKSRLYIAPSHIFQANSLGAKKQYELILFKMFLYSLASRICEIENAQAIVTGESLGQVASQTLGNLFAASMCSSKLIIRPLVGMDKQEIVDIARRIKTFDESIIPYKDVCAINRHGMDLNPNASAVIEEFERCKLPNAVEQTIKLSRIVALSI